MGAIVTRMFQDIATANDISFLVMISQQMTAIAHTSPVQFNQTVTCEDTLKC